MGRARLVLDLSCRKRDGRYWVVTDRWQKFTTVEVNPSSLDRLAGSCAEFLIHAADVEGRCEGVEADLVGMLGGWHGIPVTYAGGIRDRRLKPPRTEDYIARRTEIDYATYARYRGKLVMK